MAQQMYQVEIPSGVQPGDEFQVSIAGSLMVITCPPGVGPGSVSQCTGFERLRLGG